MWRYYSNTNSCRIMLQSSLSPGTVDFKRQAAIETHTASAHNEVCVNPLRIHDYSKYACE